MIRGPTSAAFKRKFGGCEQHFIPSQDLVYDPDAYAEYRHREPS